MKKKIASIFLFTLLIAVVMPVTGNENSDDSTLVLVRINSYQNYLDILREMEVVSARTGEYVDVIIPVYMLSDLENLNLNYDVLIWDLEKYEDSVRGSYHTLAQIESILQNIANNYPSITSLYSIGTTYEGRNIWCLEITDNPGVDEGEPGVFFMGLHHAREWPTVEICLFIANQLTSKYGSNSTITNIVNNVRLFLVACVNSDGYYYCHDLGNDWRKNRKPYSGGIGVDLNRNYGGSSDGDPWGSWGSVFQRAATHEPSQEVYCGPSPFSEYETQAIRDIFLNNDICASISWHTYSELVMWPWGYTSAYAPDKNYLKQIGEGIASKITRQSGSGTYTPQQSCTLYPTTGDTNDWSYGYGHYIQGRPTFSYTIEACSTFQPSASYLDQICQENFDGALYLLQEAENIKNNVVPRVIPPIIDELPIDIDGNYTVTWQEKNPDANPDYFQLDELTDLVLNTDDAESGSALWNLDGFTIVTNRYHSPSFSYKSRYANNDVSTMTTVVPLPVEEDTKLSFWCWYNTENKYDYAFVEVSRDGRYYEVLDSFCGSSTNWVYKEYSLDNYIGDSVFIRFRYATDEYTLQEGFYVDDISPVPKFNNINTLSNSITNNFYDITDKTNGTYYYRVKGHNTQHGWGDFSTIKKVIVQLVQNNPPNKPTIDGPKTAKPGTESIYTISTTDPDGDNVSYYIDWGDNTNTGWLGPYNSGEKITLSHIWNKKGAYTIKAKAKDNSGAESEWVLLEITVPRKITINSILIRFLEKITEQLPLIKQLILKLKLG
ncbi:MAG: M14 family zinc carboxypeptidase [Thermoplasmatota archaeon]